MKSSIWPPIAPHNGGAGSKKPNARTVAGRWRSAAKLVQPSGLAWDPVRRSLLVAECGGMCITIYDHCDPSPAGYHAEFKYATSVCVEQLGTGVVLPTRSEWGWLGITITPEGDVYVADTDQSCLHLHVDDDERGRRQRDRDRLRQGGDDDVGAGRGRHGGDAGLRLRIAERLIVHGYSP